MTEGPGQTRNESMAEPGTSARFLNKAAGIRHLKQWSLLVVEEEGVEVSH